MTSILAPRAEPGLFTETVGRVRLQRLSLATVVVVAALAYANALGNGFVLDDGAIIHTNPLVTSPAQAWRAFVSPYWPEGIGAGQYRPLGILSFALDWLIAGGDPRWFHAVNVLWHVAASALVWVLAAEVLAPAAALIAGVVFAVHPVHVEAVANVVGRLECMAAAFVLVALLAHRRDHWSAPVLFALGLLSKESAIVFLALAAANDFLLEADWRTTLRMRRSRYVAYGLVLLAYASVLLAVFRDREVAIQAKVLTGATLAERLTLVAKVLPHYVRLLVAPSQLSASYAPNVIAPDTHRSASIALGVAIVIGVAIGAVATARSRRWPLMAFALLWVPITISPVSNVLFASGVLLAERTLYLPSVGLCLAVGAIADRFVRTRPAAVAIVAAAAIVMLAARTWTRTPVWRDDRAFLLTLLADHPESYEAHLTAGRVLHGAGRLDEAERELTIARRLFARDPMVYREAAEVARRQQRPELAAVLLDSARIAPTLPVTQ